MEATFESLGLSEAMLKALEKKGYGYPTTIQAEAIPPFYGVEGCYCQGTHRHR